MIDSRGSIRRIGRQARPSANATGTRSDQQRKKVPNSTAAACPAERTAPLIPRCLPNRIRAFIDDLLAGKDDPCEAGHRPGDVDQPQRQVGEFGRAVPGKARELDAGQHEDHRQRQHAEARDDPHRGLRAARQVRPDIDLEMLRFPTPTIAPIMIVQMNRKRAISSVQM